MKPCIFAFTIAMTLLAPLSIPVRLAAQEQKEAKEHHRY
jgi:hypothetical protein